MEDLGQRPKLQRSLGKLQRTVAYVFIIADRFKSCAKKRYSTNLEGLQKKRKDADDKQYIYFKSWAPSRPAMQSAEWILLEDSQRRLHAASLESLMPVKKEVQDLFGVRRAILIIGGRPKKYLEVAFDEETLPILSGKSSLAKRYLWEAQEVDHGGVNSGVMRARSRVWITHAKKAARAIKERCFMCKQIANLCGGQVMAPTPGQRVWPALPFYLWH